jgi:TorA maturation chaperone TorD
MGGDLQAAAESPTAVPEEDALRGRFYGLLAHLLVAPPTAETLAALTRLEPDETGLGQALGSLSGAARTVAVDEAEDEYNALFIGITRGELVPYASYYLTGFLYEKPLAALREDMERLGIARAEDVAEPEDHIASLCEMMHGLIHGSFGNAGDLVAQKRFFDAHLAPWASQFFQELEAADSAVFYRPVGTLGRMFMAIEGEAFTMVG